MYCHICGIKITRNLTIFHEMTPLFDIHDSISTVIGYVKPCFEPWTGRFPHNTHHVQNGTIKVESRVYQKLYFELMVNIVLFMPLGVQVLMVSPPLQVELILYKSTPTWVPTWKNKTSDMPHIHLLSSGHWTRNCQTCLGMPILPQYLSLRFWKKNCESMIC